MMYPHIWHSTTRNRTFTYVCSSQWVIHAHLVMTSCSFSSAHHVVHQDKGSAAAAEVCGGISTSSSSPPVKSCSCILHASRCLSLLCSSAASVLSSSCAAWAAGSSCAASFPPWRLSASLPGPSAWSRTLWACMGNGGDGRGKSLSSASPLSVLCPLWDRRWKK